MLKINPIKRLTIADISSFFEKVNKTGDCWEWMAGKNSSNRYGIFRGQTAHRVAYYFYNGQPPTDKELDHLCANKGCVNPAHLEPVTHAENDKRIGFIYGQQKINLEKKFCRNGHPYNEENTRYFLSKKTGSLWKECKICRNQISANWQARKRAKVI